MPLVAGDSGKCVSSLQVLLDANRPYPGITGDRYFGGQTQQAVIDFQSAHNLAEDGVVAAHTTHAINEFSPRLSIFSYTARVVRRACRGQLRSRGNAAGPTHRSVPHHVRPPGLR
jgi:peptidoglycan hydrolase-like protein with peptidoglycan-binding domain